MAFTGAHELLAKTFVGMKFAVMPPLESELTKYMHNMIGAYWSKIHTGVLLSGYIHLFAWSRW